MSDKDFGGNDDLSLPKATVQKIINEVLSSPAIQGNGPSMTFAKETRDLLIESCVEFITMLSSEANEISEKDAKKTIAPEHIYKALEELGFGDYVPELVKVADNFKSTQVVCAELYWLAAYLSLTTWQTRERKQTKIEKSGMTEEELVRAQEELFRSAGEKYTGPGET
ncbi:negative cofactor 2 transcription regulator complex subunit ncb2 [Elasticomyces elasticus]|nr:negative cofactor 2 transcription regulator complex subunit ncb2 [Elasticomyces elasticus]KAK3649800.1 negative cofactor 2 transcription regulator complex subunit ncb2 [Elasticomyces elasticus]KAK4913068.1 negative cofactor 2 transcription regulator complex subunit ncb2 [Elasticomyces elasticus]KAK5762492.1 negative cofactor 2 transcription regulator complex subunit ncb2 [Elasticomyces elasticus]